MSNENENFLLKIKSNLRKRVNQETSKKKEHEIKKEINNNKKILFQESTENKIPEKKNELNNYKKIDIPEISEKKPEIKNELKYTNAIEMSRSSLKEGEKQIEKDKQNNVEKVIKKWQNLQKIIKEEITLEDVIIKQQENDTEILKKYFEDYYDNKIKTRQYWDEVNVIKIDYKDKVIPSYVRENDVQKKLRDACEPIKNLLFILRDNYDYSTRLISLIKKKNFLQNSEQIKSLVELFVNQFYENILIPNPEQQELLILIYKLLEEEIIPMGGVCLDNFLDNNSFLGVFLSSYSKRQDIIGYISMILNPIILSIDNETRDCLDLSISSIKRFMGKGENIRRPVMKKTKSMDFKNNNSSYEKDFLFGKIPKTNLKFKNNFELEAEKEKEDDIKFKSKDDDEINNSDNSDKNLTYVQKQRRTAIQKHNFAFGNNKDNEFNNEYKYDLTRSRLLDKMNKENNKDLKQFYIKHLERLNNYPNKYTNDGILQIFEGELEKKKELIGNYRENFLYIRDIIEKLLQSIIDKLITLPYPIRCICKIIHLFITKKFPFLSKYDANSFIGKFLLDKCIFPVLSLENKNFIEPRIFSQKTKNCLEVIIDVLKMANEASLYDTYSNPEKTIFNQFLIEIIPVLNKFYDKIIDVQLPKVVEDLISSSNNKIERTINKKIFNFRHRKKAEEKKPIIEAPQGPDNTVMPPPLFQYFEENSDEILHLESICFSADDILFIIELLKDNLQIFNDLPRYNFFTKTYKRIHNEAERLKKLKQEDNASKIKSFYIIFKEEISSQLENLKKKKKTEQKTFDINNQDSDVVCKKVKFCIKKILKGMNLLNNKDFAYLNFAQSSDKFFSALKYTLEELGEYSELSNDIPLKWYSQYIFNYKKELGFDYQKDDFEKLYGEIYTEESNKLNELKSLSSTVIARDGMNKSCAEKLINKSKYESVRIQEEKKYAKVEKFINTKKVIVCITPKEEITNRKCDFPVEIVDGKTCLHTNNSASISNEKLLGHATYIRDFINKFSDCPISEKNEKFRLQSLVLEDIKSGERTNQIFEIIKHYMDIVRKQFKEPENEYLFPDLADNEKEYSSIIENYIIRDIYKYVFPMRMTPKDRTFFYLTKSLDWIKPEHLEIKKLYVNQLKFAEKYIQKLDEAKSVYDKIDCINNAYVTMNNTVKFISGKNEDAGTDELTPLFQYILIKSHPEKLVSNINYIKTFLSEEDMLGPKGFYLSQLESASSFISGIDYKQLNMDEKEFNQKKLDSIEKYKKEKNS